MENTYQIVLNQHGLWTAGTMLSYTVCELFDLQLVALKAGQIWQVKSPPPLVWQHLKEIDISFKNFWF